jgi:alpha 1,3-glucosidase
MDISFPSSTAIFGIPEHATSFALKDTTGPNAYYHEPFRLYNLDVFEFDLDSQMALYGGIPSLFGLTATGAATGALWLNPSETFVDIETDEHGGKKSVWISESGVVDLLFMPGPTLDDIFRQQSKLTGVTPIPPMFSIAYHQCRWNYKDEADVSQVDAHFEAENFPYDVLWLDIEHTDGKRCVFLFLLSSSPVVHAS